MTNYRHDEYPLISEGGKYGIKAPDGRWVLPPVYDAIEGYNTPPDRPIYRIWQNGLGGFMSWGFEILVPCILQESVFCDYSQYIDHSVEYICRVQHTNGLYGLLCFNSRWQPEYRTHVFFTGFIYTQLTPHNTNQQEFVINGQAGILFVRDAINDLQHFFHDSNHVEKVENKYGTGW